MVATRAKAQALILAGQIKVNGHIITKSGELISPTEKIDLIKGPRYVSRGGEKLEGALKDFNLDVKDRICLDVGASTGGFTDCLLQRGAKLVYAIDVGTHQLNDSLRTDSRVVSIENTHIRDLKGHGGAWHSDASLPAPNLCVIDVSFISLKKVLPKIKELMPASSTVIALVKPQFEVGAKFLKKGVVRSEELQKQVVGEIVQFAQSLQFHYVASAPSHLKGPKGNQEYFVHLQL